MSVSRSCHVWQAVAVCVVAVGVGIGMLRGSRAPGKPFKPSGCLSLLLSLLQFIFAASTVFVANTMDRQRLDGLDGVYVVSLKRRADRLQQFVRQSGLRRGEFHHHHAVDAETMTWDPMMQALYDERNLAAITLSHMQLIKHIAATTDELHLILEDDASFADNWIDKWNKHIFPELPADVFVA